MADTATTFAGIHNENEFCSHHYLSESFSGDMRDTTARWRDAAESDHIRHDARRPLRVSSPMDRHDPEQTIGTLVEFRSGYVGNRRESDQIPQVFIETGCSVTA